MLDRMVRDAILSMCLALSLIGAAQGQGQGQLLAASVVRVEIGDSSGAGLVLSSSSTEALVLTASHLLVGKGGKARVHLRGESTASYDAEMYSEARSLADLDLAVLKVPLVEASWTFRNLPTLRTSSLNQVVFGQPVWVVGHPGGEEWVVNDQNRVQTPLAGPLKQHFVVGGLGIDQGFSGGGVFDSDGTLLGLALSVDTLGVRVVHFGAVLRALNDAGIQTDLIVPVSAKRAPIGRAKSEDELVAELGAILPYGMSFSPYTSVQTRVPGAPTNVRVLGECGSMYAITFLTVRKDAVEKFKTAVRETSDLVLANRRSTACVFDAGLFQLESGNLGATAFAFVGWSGDTVPLWGIDAIVKDTGVSAALVSLNGSTTRSNAEPINALDVFPGAQTLAQAKLLSVSEGGIAFNTGDAGIVVHYVRPAFRRAYEALLNDLRDVGRKSSVEHRRQQVEGWRVLRNDEREMDGALMYIHVFSPAVIGADYNLLTLTAHLLPERVPSVERLLRDASVGQIKRIPMTLLHAFSFR